MNHDANSPENDQNSVQNPDQQSHHVSHSTDHKHPSSDSSKGIVRFSINYPYFIVVSCMIVILLGTLSMLGLPKDLLPAANQPAVQILSFYPGMPVDTIAMDITERFERYTGQAIGMEKQDSKSLSSVSIVRNYFNPSVDLNTAIAQTTSLVMSVLRKLPPGTQPPIILPFDATSTVPLALVAVSGDVPEKRLVDIGRYDVGNSVQSIPGAMAPTIMGGADRQVVVFLDPVKLEKFNFSPLDVLSKVTQLNSFIPTGDIKMGMFDYQILSNGLADHIQDMNEYPLRSENGVTVKLKDIGEASDAHKIQTNVVMIDGKRQVYVPVYRQPGANSIAVVDSVREKMKKLQEKFTGIGLKVVADQSVFIRHAIDSITEETIIGGGLAAVMVLLFLGNPTATIGILLSIPLSLLFAFLGLKLTGQSLNAMTLGGLALSIGVLVDNSIVVLENISRQRQNGKAGMKAAIDGASEVAMPVLASTLATMVVLFPVVFLSGISKTLFTALAIAVCFAMVGSYFAAMTVIPLFASKFLAGRIVKPHELWLPLRVSQRLMEKLTQFYARVLLVVLKRKLILAAVVVFIFCIGAALAPMIGTELFPRADAGSFILKTRLASGTRIEESAKFAEEINGKLRQWIPKEDLSMIITNVGVLYGYSAAFTPNTGTQDAFYNIDLKDDRVHSSQQLAKIIRARMKTEYPNVEIGIELGGLLTSALNGGLPSPIDIQVEGEDQKEARKIAESILPDIQKLRGAVDVRIQQRVDAPQLFLTVDRSKADAYGLSVDSIMKSVVSAVSGSASFLPAIWVDPKSGIDYQFGVQMPEDKIRSIQDLESIPLTGPHQDRGVTLSHLAKITEQKGPSEIDHVNLAPVVDLYLDGQDRDVGGLSRDVQAIIDRLQVPKGYSVHIRGEIEEMNCTVKSLEGGFILAALLVYFILTIQFESFVIPAIVLATVPMGLVGIISMLVLTKTYFSIQAAIGAIFMIGIAVANGVLLIEFLIHQCAELRADTPAALRGAIIDASRLRLRPIMMTSLSSILGLVPMAIGLGHGAEANIPLGRAVIGGQLLSTVLTLFLVPLLFEVLAGYQLKRRKVGASSLAKTANVLATLAVAVMALAIAAPASAASAPPDGSPVVDSPARDHGVPNQFLGALPDGKSTFVNNGSPKIGLMNALKRMSEISPLIREADERVKAAEAGIGIADSKILPQISLSAMWSHGEPGSFAVPGVDADISSTLREGVGAGVDLQQDIYDFGRHEHEAASEQHRKRVEETSIEGEKSKAQLELLHVYADCSYLTTSAATAARIVTLSKLVAKETDRFVRSGQRSIIERYTVDAQTEEATTRLAETEAKLQVVRLRLGQLLQLKFPAQSPVCGDLNELYEESKVFKPTEALNSFVQVENERLLQFAELKKFAHSSYMPKLFLEAQGGYFSDDKLAQPWNYAVGVGITLPLYTGDRIESQVQEASAKYEAQRAVVARTEEKIEQENLGFDEEIQSLRVRLAYLDKENKLAMQVFDLAKKRYSNLQGTMIDLRDSIRELSRVLEQRDSALTRLSQALAERLLWNESLH